MHNYVYVHVDSVSPSDREAADSMDSTIDTGKQDSHTDSFKFIYLLLSVTAC